MNTPSQPDREFDRRLASALIDALIRAGLILLLAILCYRIFSPFLPLMIWALILGYIMFGEAPTPMIVLGCLIIAAAGLFVIWRERQLAAARKLAASTPQSVGAVIATTAQMP